MADWAENFDVVERFAAYCPVVAMVELEDAHCAANPAADVTPAAALTTKTGTDDR